MATRAGSRSYPPVSRARNASRIVNVEHVFANSFRFDRQFGRWGIMAQDFGAEIDDLSGRVDGHDKRLSEVEKGLAVQVERVSNISEDVKTIKDNTRWLLRLIIGTLIVGGITLLMKYGGV